MNTMNRRSLALAGLAFATIATSTLAQPEVQPLMGKPLHGLSAAELQRFENGRIEFSHILTVAEGLGPIFNDSSCAQCHGTPAVGGFGTQTVTRFGNSGPPFDPLANLGGSLRQLNPIPPSFTNPPGIDCTENIPPQANVTTPRLTPPVFGAGLVSAIDDQDIIFFQNNPPSPFVGGIARMVQPVEGGPMRAGKFGWKGGVATMLTFSADASVNEMGLTNRFFGSENAPNGNLALLAQCDTIADPEDGPQMPGFDRIDLQTDFQNFLAAPPQTPKSGMSGEVIFKNVGCADCHVDKVYVTNDPNAPDAILNGQSIKPYSDFLLHDMGTLGDRIVDGVATEQLMKTAPLWGLQPRGNGSLLHDGVATGGTFEQNVDTAIQAHDGEGATARVNYLALSQPDKDKLYAFLASLGSAEFDFERNNNRDVIDWFFLQPLFTGPGGSIGPDDAGAIGDHDEDGSFDMRDWVAFQRAFDPNQ